MSPPLSRQQQHAAHGMKSLDRHGHHSDHLAALVDAPGVRRLALKCLADFRIALSVLGLAVGLQIAAREPRLNGKESAFQKTRLLGARRRQFELHHVAAAVEIATVEDQTAVAVVDARPRIRRQDQAAQQGPDPLEIDRKFEPEQGVVVGAVAFAGMEFQQALGVDVDDVGVVRRLRRDGDGDEIALHREALGARLDQASAELGQIDDAENEHEQAGDVEKDDAPREARKRLGDEELPAAAKGAADTLGAQCRPGVRRRTCGSRSAHRAATFGHGASGRPTGASARRRRSPGALQWWRSCQARRWLLTSFAQCPGGTLPHDRAGAQEGVHEFAGRRPEEDRNVSYSLNR